MNTVSTISNCAGSHKRIAWIDVSKGFGIYFIVLGHLLISGTLRKWIFAFHVPFFFFLSGLTFNVSQPFFTFLKKKFFSIMLPYYFFSILSIGIYDVMVKAVPSFGGGRTGGETDVDHALWKFQATYDDLEYTTVVFTRLISGSDLCLWL